MTTPVNTVSDLSNLLKIPLKVMNELTSKTCLCIGNAINDAKQAGESQVSINIGIGTLSINLLDMQCKFIPGKELKAVIKETLESQVDPLELALEKAFTDKLLVICEEVL